MTTFPNVTKTAHRWRVDWTDEDNRPCFIKYHTYDKASAYAHKLKDEGERNVKIVRLYREQ